MQSNDDKTDFEVIEIEVFAREGKPVPKNKHYKIRVDKEIKVVRQHTISGREILALVGKTPEQYHLYQHFHKSQTKLIQPDEVVDLTIHGIERFTTLKIENTEG